MTHPVYVSLKKSVKINDVTDLGRDNITYQSKLIFMNYLPWILMMRRPNHDFSWKSMPPVVTPKFTGTSESLMRNVREDDECAMERWVVLLFHVYYCYNNNIVAIVNSGSDIIRWIWR